MVRLSRMQSRSWGYCTMLSPRMQPSAWVLKSRLGQLAGARARGLHSGQSAPWAARWRSCSSRGQRTSAPGDVFLRTRRGRAANETLPSKKELESCPPPYLTSEGQIKEKARKYAASAYLPLLFSPALGQLLVGPLSHGCAVPASRLPPRSAAGQRPTGT